MSISFEFTREPSGWRFGTDRQIDLTNWDLDYQSNGIRCTPTPMDFVYMAFGASLFLTIAIYMLIATINPRWLGFASADRPIHVRNAMPGLLLANPKDPVLSKFQQDAATPDEVRQASEQLMESLLKDKSPEDKAGIVKKIQEAANANQEQYAPRKTIDVFDWLIVIARVLAVVPISILSFIGSLCLARALRYFRDYLELSVTKRSLTVRRPKLLGGISGRVLPLDEISSISCYALRKNHGRFPHVKWYVAIASTHSIQDCLQFVVEHIPGRASRERPTERVRHFAEALHRMTGAPVIYQEP